MIDHPREARPRFGSEPEKARDALLLRALAAAATKPQVARQSRPDVSDLG